MAQGQHNWMQKKIIDSKHHQDMAFDSINGLVVIDRRGKEIELACGTKLVEFISCSYLGLDQDPRLIHHAKQDMNRFGISFHCARTRVQPTLYLDLEKLLSGIYCQSYPVVFPTIHMAHLGFFPLLGSGEMPNFPCKKNGFCFIVDRTVHFSVRINQGLLSQFGEVIIVDFNDIAQVEKQFKLACRNNITPVAIADGIGSMGGMVPVKQLLCLAEQYDGYVYLDDAHGTSIHGKQGAGYVLKSTDYYFHPKLILVTTLGKAFGALGGVIVLKEKEDADFVKRFAPTYVFGGPPALSMMNAAIASSKIHLTDEIHTLQHTLWDNVRYFDELLSDHIINNGLLSPTRGIYIGEEQKAIDISTRLKDTGYIVTTAMYPTVEKNHSMLRVALSSAHTKQQIRALCHEVKAILQ